MPRNARKQRAKKDPSYGPLSVNDDPYTNEPTYSYNRPNSSSTVLNGQTNEPIEMETRSDHASQAEEDEYLFRETCEWDDLVIRIWPWALAIVLTAALATWLFMVMPAWQVLIASAAILVFEALRLWIAAFKHFNTFYGVTKTSITIDYAHNRWLGIFGTRSKDILIRNIGDVSVTVSGIQDWVTKSSDVMLQLTYSSKTNGDEDEVRQSSMTIKRIKDGERFKRTIKAQIPE